MVLLVLWLHLLCCMQVDHQEAGSYKVPEGSLSKSHGFDLNVDKQLINTAQLFVEHRWVS